MQKLIAFCFLVCCVFVAVLPTAHAQSTQDQILRRLNALEQENAALRARVNHLERKAALNTATPAPAQALSPFATAAPTLASPPPVAASAAEKSVALNAAPEKLKSEKPRPRFEVSGSVMFLQPGVGDFSQYAEVANPFPVPSPNWSNQSINPAYSPAFNVALRYMPDSADDFSLDWTHLRATDNSSVTANSSQFVGPPYSIGPPAGASFTGGSANGSLQTQYDSVNLTARHNFCVDCSIGYLLFGGVEYARLGETLTGNFADAATSTSHSYVSRSLFNGAGPRIGIRGQYDVGQWQFFGEGAGAALIGSSQNNINFTTTSPALAALGISTNDQSLTSPDATEVVPSIDGKVGVAYAFPPTNYGALKLELGYRVATYFDAVNQYEITNVATSPLAGGVYLATERQLQTNLTVQGPYLQASWAW